MLGREVVFSTCAYFGGRIACTDIELSPLCMLFSVPHKHRVLMDPETYDVQ